MLRKSPIGSKSFLIKKKEILRKYKIDKEQQKAFSKHLNKVNIMNIEDIANFILKNDIHHAINLAYILRFIDSEQDIDDLLDCLVEYNQYYAALTLAANVNISKTSKFRFLNSHIFDQNGCEIYSQYIF